MTIPYLNAGKGIGNFYSVTLPVHIAQVDRLPLGTSAIIVTADLQGRETFDSAAGQPLRLLGEVVPSLLATQILSDSEFSQGEVGVFLAGDFYTVPGLDKRGGTGDVTPVRRAFSDQFDWVCGVPGEFGFSNYASDFAE